MKVTNGILVKLLRRAATGCAALGLLLASSPPVPASERGPVRVFCAASEVDGFHHPGAVPSAKDLTGALGKKKRIVLVGTRSDADVVVVVTGREVVDGGERVSRSVIVVGKGRGRGSDTVSRRRIRHKTVYATLSAGNFEVDLEAYNQLSWRLAAAGLAGQVADWIDENADQILERRAERESAAAEVLAVKPPRS